MSSVLRIQGLKFHYQKEAILKRIDMEVMSGEFVALTGRNGAGKSTLLNLILGNLRGYEGNIQLFEQDIQLNNQYDKIAYISQHSVQNYRNFPTTIAEVVRVHLKYLKKKVDVDQVLEMVELTGQKHKLLSELSGGQLQRVGVLLALLKDAQFILLDEPTTGIDQQFSRELFEMLRQLTKMGKTVLMVTHQLDDAIEFVDKVYEIKSGTCQLVKGEQE